MPARRFVALMIAVSLFMTSLEIQAQSIVYRVRNADTFTSNIVPLAQVIDPQQITTFGSSCSTATACAVFNSLGTSAGYAYTISGTFSGTLQFEGTLDGVNWFATAVTKLSDLTTVASSTTGTGQFKIANNGWLALRVRASALASGMAVVSVTRGYAW